MPTSSPTTDPTPNPSYDPTAEPTMMPSSDPTMEPTTSEPTMAPSPMPTDIPSSSPTEMPSQEPTTDPSAMPTTPPTMNPVTPAPTIECSRIELSVAGAGAERVEGVYYQHALTTSNGYPYWDQERASYTTTSQPTHFVTIKFVAGRWTVIDSAGGIQLEDDSESTALIPPHDSVGDSWTDVLSDGGTTYTVTIECGAITDKPTTAPTGDPTSEPTGSPSTEPTMAPTTMEPTEMPSSSPTHSTFHDVSSPRDLSGTFYRVIYRGLFDVL